MWEHETKIDDNVEDPLSTDSRIRSFGNVDLDQVIKEQHDDDAEITFMGATALDQVMKEANSDLESMPDDEIMSISMDDDEEADSDRELYVADELVADNVIDEILTEINKKDTTKIVSVASNTKVLSVSVSQSALVCSLRDVQALAAKTL
ncbi:hypothetical protein Tco_0813690 [Tanacetum coccineum]